MRQSFFWYDTAWRVIRPLLVFVLSLFIVSVLVVTVYDYINTAYLLPGNPADTQPVEFTVEVNDSLSKVARNLEEQEFIRNRTVFQYYADFMGVGQKIRAGKYSLTRDMGFDEILAKLTLGDGSVKVRNITITPGWTVEDIAAYLVKENVLATPNTFLEICKTGELFKEYMLVSEVRASKEWRNRKYVLEGYLSPDTYEIFVDTDEVSIIKKLLLQTDNVFSNEQLYDRAAELKMTVDQVLALASMIEKEGKTSDFKKISAVFHNRLAQNMRLESDVTVKYVLNTKRISLRDQDISVLSPYNTYTNSGLPIGAICSPSRAAIQAAIYPDEDFLVDGYLFFCTSDIDKRELTFTKTLKEHQAVVDEMRPVWQAYDRQQGY